MIKLKQEVNKSEIMHELKAEAEIAFENTWQKEMQIRAYLNGAHDLFKKLRIAHVSGSLLFTCGDCGMELTEVRPGKHQCDNEKCKSNDR